MSLFSHLIPGILQYRYLLLELFYLFYENMYQDLLAHHS